VSAGWRRPVGERGLASGFLLGGLRGVGVAGLVRGVELVAQLRHPISMDLVAVPTGSSSRRSLRRTPSPRPGTRRHALAGGDLGGGGRLGKGREVGSGARSRRPSPALLQISRSRSPTSRSNSPLPHQQSHGTEPHETRTRVRGRGFAGATANWPPQTARQPGPGKTGGAEPRRAPKPCTGGRRQHARSSPRRKPEANPLPLTCLRRCKREREPEPEPEPAKGS
jgi:hypothetical protein